jgi:hypothetical protein
MTTLQIFDLRIFDRAQRYVPDRDQRPAKIGTRVATSAALACLLVLSYPQSVSSQSIELVRVNVAKVDDGFRASKLVGQSVVNDKNEKIGSLDDIVIGRDGTL